MKSLSFCLAAWLPCCLAQAADLQAQLDALAASPPTHVMRITESHTLTQSLRVPSNVTITCAEGVVIEAAPGAFKEAADVDAASLVVLTGVNNVRVSGCTFRMRGSAWYRDPANGYALSEFRHAVRVTGSRDVSFRDCRFESSGGDGLYVGPLVQGGARTPCVNIVAQGCHFDRNHRQGMSVVAGSVTVEDCTFTRTQGTSPQSGFDAEPATINDAVNVTVRRSHSAGNRGPAWMVGLFASNGQSPPSRIVLEEVTYEGVPDDQPAFRLGGLISDEFVSGVTARGLPHKNLPKGTHVTINGVVIVDVRRAATSWARPVSDDHLRCVVNMDGHALPYADRWSAAPLITDLSVFVEGLADPPGRHRDILARASAPAGRYVSGARVVAAHRQFPPEAVAAALIPPAFLRAGTSDRVDIENPDAFALFYRELTALDQAHPAPLLFVDNIVHPSALSGWIPWPQTCLLLASLRESVARRGGWVIANVAVASWGMSDADVGLLSDSVDGMAFEIPFHPLARKSAASAARQVEVYRAWLDRGKIVVLIPIPPDTEARFIAGFAAVFREPGDSLFVAWPFFKDPPDWQHWPRDLGLPAGPLAIDADTLVMTRRFARGRVTVHLTTGSVETTFAG